MAAQPTGGNVQGGGDPISAIANAVTSIYNFYGKGIDALTYKGKARWANLPEWLRPGDFQEEDHTMEYLLGGLAAVFVIIVLAIAIVATRKR